MPEEGRESPPPETQTGAQLHDPPASGQGVQSMENKDKVVKSELDVRFFPPNPQKLLPQHLST
jgi:hypothetical protein